jgi:hypothetical protein
MLGQHLRIPISVCKNLLFRPLASTPLNLPNAEQQFQVAGAISSGAAELTVAQSVTHIYSSLLQAMKNTSNSIAQLTVYHFSTLLHCTPFIVCELNDP